MTSGVSTRNSAVTDVIATPRRPHVTVCVCTYRRPGMLARLLHALERQTSDGRFTWETVVVDNDSARSGAAIVNAAQEQFTRRVSYTVETERNIALARNRAVAAATGEYVAFLDDDEFPVPDWMRLMLATLEKHRADAVLGPVRPHFDTPPPRWIVDGRFCERPEHPTGTWMPWPECRTGNVLFRRTLVQGDPEPFRRQFNNGGEDVDFFQRQAAAGRRFVWCNEAVAYESVPPARCTRSYMLRRALLRGRNGLKLSRGRAGLIARSIVAVPAYALWLPAAAVLGQATFMKYCIKFCDHLGRLLTIVRLNPVHERSS